MPGTEKKFEYVDEWLSKAESALGRAKRACQFETGASSSWES
jgi:hypothetical protein